MYARIKDGVVVSYPVDPRLENPATSFPENWLGGALHGVEYVYVSYSDVPQVPHTQNFIEGVPEIVEGRWAQTWIVVDASPSEIEIRVQEQWRNVRNDRNARLAACDWTQLADATVNASTWASYRQQLRDLPQTQTDPFNIVWPATP